MTLIQEGNSLTLRAAVDLFLGSLSENRAEVQQDLLKFLRWFGREKPSEELTPLEIEAYGAHVVSGAAHGERHLKAVRGFLAFARKKGLTRVNLVSHLRVRRASQKRASGGIRMKSEEGDPIRLTAEGIQHLKERLDWLHDEAVRTATEIRKAAADKDVRENAPLEAARQYQGQIVSRVQEIEGILERAELLRESATSETVSRVRQGSRVTLRDTANGEELTYILVDPREANTLDGKLSMASPVGQALLDQRQGEEVVVKAPRGALRYRIVSVG